jgi:hypothetical protein
MLPVRARAFVIGACTIGLLLTFSSAPIQSVILGLALIGYDRCLPQFPFRWTLLLASGVVGLLVIFSVTNSPISYINEHLIFDPSSGWYRVWEWQTAGAIVNQHPWVGIAFSWELIAEQAGIVNSIDSLWLYMALIYGYPGAILLGLSFVSSAWHSTSRHGVSPEERKLGAALGILVFLVIFLGFTVHFWATIWILIGLLIGLRAHLSAIAASRSIGSSNCCPGNGGQRLAVAADAVRFNIAVKASSPVGTR